jgi:ABC-type glycerol-3-phosphate transport system substrate-binding protein
MVRIMKTMKRTLAGILILAMRTGAFAGCSTATTDEAGTPAQIVTPTAAEETEPAPEEAVYISDDLPSPDYEGYDYRILSCNFYNKELATYLTFDEITGDPVDDVLYASRDNIQNRFNIGIRWIETGDTTAGRDAVKKAVTAGDDAFDILIGHDTNTFGLGKDGYLYNLMAVEQFNFDKPWWPKNTVESLRIGNKMYAASSYLSYCGLHWTRVITFNKEMLREAIENAAVAKKEAKAEKKELKAKAKAEKKRLREERKKQKKLEKEAKKKAKKAKKEKK